MPDVSDIVRERQSAIRREMDRRSIALKVVACDSGLPYDTLLSYFPHKDSKRIPAVIPASAIFVLAEKEALPLDLLSFLVPAGFLIVKVPEAVDHDEASMAMRDYLRAKDAAHHPESEAGRDIGPGEDKALRAHLTVVQAAAA